MQLQTTPEHTKVQGLKLDLSKLPGDVLETLKGKTPHENDVNVFNAISGFNMAGGIILGSNSWTNHVANESSQSRGPAL